MMPALKVRNPERKNVEESHMDEIETRPWSDLPQDLSLPPLSLCSGSSSSLCSLQGLASTTES